MQSEKKISFCVSFAKVTLCYFMSCFTLALAAETAEVSFSGTLLESPPCVVNNSRDIVVDFGDEVMTTRIDGNQYKQKIDFTLDCTSAVSSKQKIRISGATTTSSSGFNWKILSTPKTGLGIAIFQSGGDGGSVHYSPGEWVNFNVPNTPTFYAVLEKNKNQTLSGGAFNVRASLVVEYQ